MRPSLPLRQGRGRDKRMSLELEQRLRLVRDEHRDLDAAIAALSAQPLCDQLQLARLKKRKLRLRDEIMWIESQLIPDIIA